MKDATLTIAFDLATIYRMMGLSACEWQLVWLFFVVVSSFVALFQNESSQDE